MRSRERPWYAAALTVACATGCILPNDFRRGESSGKGAAGASGSSPSQTRADGAGRSGHDSGGSSATSVSVTFGGTTGATGGIASTRGGSGTGRVEAGGAPGTGGNLGGVPVVAGGTNTGGTSPVGLGGNASSGNASGGNASGGNASGGNTGGNLGVAGATGQVDLTNCVLLFHLDEASWNGTAGEVKDASGLGNHGTAQLGATVGTFAKFSRAGAFDGSGYIAVADSPTLRPNNALTLAAWIYPTSFPADGPGILSKRREFSVDSAFALFIWAENRLYADIDTENDRFSSTFRFASDAWYHVALVFDGSLDPQARARLYINGSLDSVHYEQSSTVTGFDSPLEVGRIPGGGAAFVGAIDEVAIWRRALGPSEIAALYYATGPIALIP